jgi:ABC-type multidrug transport system fused ATPase/permease subunit
MRNILTIIGLIKDGRRLFNSSLVLLAIAGIGGALSPLFLGGALNQLTKLATAHTTHAVAIRNIVILLAGYLLVRIVTGIFDWTGSIAGNYLGYNLHNGLRERIISQLMHLQLDFYERQRVGEIMEKVGTGVGDLTNWVANLLGFMFAQLIGLIVSLLVITHIEPLLGVAMLIVTITNTFFKQRIRNITTPLLKEGRIQEETASGLASEAISNMATVRSFGREDSIMARIRAALDKYVTIQKRADFMLERTFWTGEYFVLFGTVIGLGVIAIGVVTGRHTPGDLLLGTLYFQQIASNSRPLGRLITSTAQTDTSAGRIVELLQEPALVVDAPDAVDLEGIGDVEFRDVSFAYPGNDRQVLDRVSFHLPAGRSLALVGPSGVGKTTITKLLLRFYEPTGGQILIGGRDVHEFTQDSVRRHIGVVMQDVALFNETIEANLRFANPDATEHELQAAAHSAHADVFIDKLPDRYATLVGERGIRLSGGEKQRIAVARAILRSPELIILDEATSALDSESERYVQDGLSRLMRQRTAVIIAHRLSTVMKADQILVLEGGRVVDSGTHHELTSKKTGLYSRLFKLQTEGALDPKSPELDHQLT